MTFQAVLEESLNRNNNNLYTSKTAMLRYSRSKTKPIKCLKKDFFEIFRLVTLF